MCTAATYQTKDFYIGRTLDYEFSYGDQITITPRNYPFRFRYMGQMTKSLCSDRNGTCGGRIIRYITMLSMRKVLGMAGLNFVGNAAYESEKADRENVAQFEFIPWVLSQCASMNEVRTLLERINLTGTSFSPQLPTAGLHWIIADKDDCITVESMADGLHIYDNPVGILTNNPPFDMQMFQLNNYMSLSAKQPENSFAPELGLSTYSRGMGAMGLPGDLSSASRFVRAAFVKQHSVSGESEAESVSQFFHILGAVDQPRGCCDVGEGKYEITIYTSCCNASKGIYYYTTYENHQITAVDMHRVDLDGEQLVTYEVVTGERINRAN